MMEGWPALKDYSAHTASDFAAMSDDERAEVSRSALIRLLQMAWERWAPVGSLPTSALIEAYLGRRLSGRDVNAFLMGSKREAPETEVPRA